MASLSLRTTTRVLAAPRNLKVVGLSSPSFTPAVKPWFRQACEPLRASSFQVSSFDSRLGFCRVGKMAYAWMREVWDGMRCNVHVAWSLPVP